MSNLIAKIDRANRTAVISGQGTFVAKDTIKQLGRARWNGDNKEWIIENFNISDDELQQKLFGIVIESANSNITAYSELATPSLPVAEAKPQDKSTIDGLSVEELYREIKSTLSSRFSLPICVYGVLTSVKRVESRVFLELADIDNPNTKVSCVIWSGEKEICKELVEKGFSLEKDLQIMFKTQVDLNKTRGQISLRILGIVIEFTIGKVAAERERTNKRLKAEGLFDRNRHLDFAFLPRRIGILTSAAGTVINDFRAALDDSKFGFELFWSPVSVQGKQAVREVVNGLKLLQEINDLDVIVIFRGGGSPAELALFNDYEIARSICLSKIPVLSAIGHEEDQCSVQDVSYRAFGVPKAIGLFIAEIVQDLRRRLHQAALMIANASFQEVRNADERIAGISRSLPIAMQSLLQSSEYLLNNTLRGLFNKADLQVKQQVTLVSSIVHTVQKSAELFVTYCSNKIISLSEMLSQQSNAYCMQRVESLRRLSIIKHLASVKIDRMLDATNQHGSLLNEVDPSVQLKRGFVIVRDVGGTKIIRGGKSLATDDSVELEFFDIKRRAIIGK